LASLATAGEAQNLSEWPMINPAAVVVSRASIESNDPSQIVASNIDFVNGLFDEYVEASEVVPDALRSYYVDYYLAQILNGGFSQFVYNSRWNEQVIQFIRDGLRAIGARTHAQLFDDGETLLNRLGPERRKAFSASDYFGENEERDELNAINERFMQISKTENLVALNAAWLRGLTDLVVLSDDEMKSELKRRGEAVTNREQRIAAALASEPRYMKLIRALCERSGQALQTVTGGDPERIYAGQKTMAIHFITDCGHHHLVDHDGMGIMFRGFTEEEICRFAMPDDDSRKD
jgi:hypothetical protein